MRVLEEGEEEVILDLLLIAIAALLLSWWTRKSYQHGFEVGHRIGWSRCDDWWIGVEEEIEWERRSGEKENQWP